MYFDSRIEDIKAQLSRQIFAEFREGFRRAEPDFSICTAAQLFEGCAVLDVLGPEIPQKLRSWFIGIQLRDYRDVFHPNKVCWSSVFECRTGEGGESRLYPYGSRLNSRNIFDAFILFYFVVCRK